MNRYMMSLGGWSALVYANDEDQIVRALAPVSLRQHEVFDAPIWQDEWIGLPRFYLNSEDGVVRFQRDVAVAERNELLDRLEGLEAGAKYELEGQVIRVKGGEYVAELIGWDHFLLGRLLERASRSDPATADTTPGLALALQIVREVAKTQAGYSDEREAIFEALSEAYVESQAPEQMLETGRRSGLATLLAAQPTYEELRQRLLDLAEVARSKAHLIAGKSPTSGYAHLIAGKSPTSGYAHPVDVLRAVAEEAEAGLIKQPNAHLTHAEALDQIQKLLSGKEWDSATTVDISEVMGAAGYVIKDVDESGEPDTGYETLEYSVCTDCFQFIANDEVPEDKDHAFYAGKIALELGGKEGHFSVGLADLDEELQDDYDEFSNQECELCRSHLAGSRHGVTLFIKKD